MNFGKQGPKHNHRKQGDSDDLPDNSGPHLSRTERKHTFDVTSRNYNEQQGGTLPEGSLVRDPLLNIAISHYAMRVTDNVKPLLLKYVGRTLSTEESVMIATVLDYIHKREANYILKKQQNEGKDLGEKRELSTNLRENDPSLDSFNNLEFKARHDIAHFVLSIKQGKYNGNSPVPTFEQSRLDPNTESQAMLEEGFATMFTAFGKIFLQKYDTNLKDTDFPKEKMQGYIRYTKNLYGEMVTLFGVPLFQTNEINEKAKLSLLAFLEECVMLYEDANNFANTIVSSQIGSINELISSDAFMKLSEEERFVFIQDRITDALENTRALTTGVVPTGKSGKYRATVEITRNTYAEAEKKAKEFPEKTIFAEILLETFKELYPKAKNQQERTYRRVLRNK